MSDCITWEEGDIAWDATDFTWSEICLLVEIVQHSGGYSERTRKLREKDKQTQKTFIKLLCKIKGEEYEETKYFRPDVRVRAGDFKIIDKFLEKPQLSIFINKEK
jgi:hypothetical protein|tara:strand:+ start:257 stop:571 length:315 start_codon:yes stop_codon:yes gene_type:complete